MRYSIVLACALLAAQQSRPQLQVGAPTQSSKSAPQRPGGTLQTANLLDVNRATHAELLKLSGLTELDVEHIEQGRPYKDKTELLAKHILTNSQYNSLQSKLGPVPNTGTTIRKPN